MKVVFVVEHTDNTYFIFSVSSETAKTVMDIKEQMSTACGLWAKQNIYKDSTTNSTYFWFFKDAEESQEFRDILTTAGLTFTFIADMFTKKDKDKFVALNPEVTMVKAEFDDVIPIKLDVILDYVYWDTDDDAEEAPDLPSSVILHLKDNDEVLSDVLSDEYGFCVNDYHIRDIKVL